MSAVLGRRVFALPKLPRDFYKIALAASVMALVYVSVASYRGVFALAVQLLIGVAAYTVFLVALNVGDSRRRIAGLIYR